MPDTSLPLPAGRSASQLVSDIILRRDESRKSMKEMNEEWAETWRAIKCRTLKRYKKDAAGKETKEEDKGRTNVEMGLANLIYRKNVARLSAQPYSLRVLGGSDPTVAPRMSAVLAQQYDRSKERAQDVRVRMSAEALGVGYSKLYWDTVVRQMVFRKAMMKGGQVMMRDRKSLMQFQRAPEDEINGALAEKGNDLTDQEVADFIQKSGSSDINVPETVPKYEGPCVLFRFPGDVYREPFAKTLEDSSYIIDSYRESDLWLEKMLKLTYTDPQTGQEQKAFDPIAVDALRKADPSPTTATGEYSQLRDMFRSAIGQQSEPAYQFPRNLRVRKMYDILEEHTQDDYGCTWITWIAEGYRDLPLGRMPYPWDLYGQSAFTEEVPLPDLIDAIGDSTPRLLRYLFQLYNIQTAQNFDYVTNMIKKVLLVKTGTEFEGEPIERALHRIQKVSDPNGVVYLNDPPLPSGAMERGAQILQNIGLFEPSMNQVDAGSAGNPMAGRTATTAILAAKAADALLNFKLEGRNLYLWELGMKKLWMNQQRAQEQWNVESKFFGRSLQESIQGFDQNPDQRPEWALSDRMGKTTAIKLDPMEIQEDLEVEPEAGSYLSVDDELKKNSAQELDQIALAAPNILDPRKVIRFHLSTIRGIGNPDDYFADDKPTPPPPPKVNANLTGKMEDYPEFAAAILSSYGRPSPSADELAQVNSIKRVSEAADHADNLLSPGEHDKQLSMKQQQMDAKEKAKPKKKADGNADSD